MPLALRVGEGPQAKERNSLGELEERGCQRPPQEPPGATALQTPDCSLGGGSTDSGKLGEARTVREQIFVVLSH